MFPFFISVIYDTIILGFNMKYEETVYDGM